MRFINLYLIGYFILILGALAALWYGGVLRHVSGMWIAIGLVIADRTRHHAVGLRRQTHHHQRVGIAQARSAPAPHLLYSFLDLARDVFQSSPCTAGSAV